MEGMAKRVRTIRNTIEAEGLAVQNISVKDHVKVRVHNGKETRMFVFSTSAGDHRHLLNQRALLRRFAKEGQ